MKVSIHLTAVVTEYVGAGRREYVPGYDDAAFAAFVARCPKLFRVCASTDSGPVIEYDDPMAGRRPVGIIAGVVPSNAVAISRSRAIDAAAAVHIRCEE